MANPRSCVAVNVRLNSAFDVPARLEALGLLGGLSREALHAQVAAGLQVVLHLRRSAWGGLRQAFLAFVPALLFGAGLLAMLLGLPIAPLLLSFGLLQLALTSAYWCYGVARLNELNRAEHETF